PYPSTIPNPEITTSTAVENCRGIAALTATSAPTMSASSRPPRTRATKPTVRISVSSMRPAAVTYQPVTASCMALIEDSPASCTMMQETTTMDGLTLWSIRATSTAPPTATTPPSTWL